MTIQINDNFATITGSNNEKRNKIISAFISQYVCLPFLEKLVNVVLYDVDIAHVNAAGRNVNILKEIKRFLNDCYNDVDKLKLLSLTNSTSHIKEAIRFSKQIVDLKQEIGGKLLTYDNIETHFPSSSSLIIKPFIQNIKNNQIKSIQDFKSEFEIITQTIQLSDEIRLMKNTLLEWDLLIDSSDNNNKTNSVPLLNLIGQYKELLINSYTDLSKLRVLNKTAKENDYILISDKNSITKRCENLMYYLSNNYYCYRSGYDIIDKNLGGIETSSLHVICGPSNHGKSLLMVNLLNQLIINNADSFKDNDCILFYTLEDAKEILESRFISVLGNYDSTTIRESYKLINSIMAEEIEENAGFNISNTIAFRELCEVLSGILSDVYSKILNKKITLIIQDGDGGEVSVSDINRFMDARKAEGINTKILICDYIDRMIPSGIKNNTNDDYVAHGLIMQELKMLAKNYGIPVISATQGTRDLEDAPILSNKGVADSYKKVRYADFVYIIRMPENMLLTNDNVKQDITKEDPNNPTVSIPFQTLNNDYNQYLKVYEIKITKAKSGTKNVTRYHVFNGRNCRINQNLEDVYVDLKELEIKSKDLIKKVQLVRVSSKSLTTFTPSFGGDYNSNSYDQNQIF